MRVMQVLTRPVGGAAQQVRLIDQGLASSDIESVVTRGIDTMAEGVIELGEQEGFTVRSLRRPVNPINDYRAFWELKRLIREWRPDVIHTHQSKAGVLGRLAAFAADIPAIHTFHGPSLDELFSRHVAAVFAALERRLAGRTATLVAASEALRDELLSRGIGDADRWRVVPNAVDFDALRRRRVDRDSARSALGLPRHGPIVGVIGRLTPVKDHRLFIECAARLSAERTNLRFAVAGTGKLRASLERFANRLVGDRVHFIGHVEDPALFLSAVDVLAITSRYEGTPLAAIEAGGLGVPVVALDVGGVAEVVQRGMTGDLVRGRDAAALAGALGDLLGDDERRTRYGASAARTYPERFGVARLVRDVTAIYEDALRGWDRVPAD